MKNQIQNTISILHKDGREDSFNEDAIYMAIQKANETVDKKDKMPPELVNVVAIGVRRKCEELSRAVSTEEISNYIEDLLMNYRFFEVARSYITYRYKHLLMRKHDGIYDAVLSLIERNNEEIKQENSNKNPTVNSVQRDYMAGEISKRLTTELLLDPEIVEAHNDGLIHFHDSDYFAQHMHNCCLVNLEDMLQNGTVISETMIERPQSFKTACNVSTQIIAQVASQQYGGQTINLAHLVPFVDVSRQKLKKKELDRLTNAGIAATEEQIMSVVDAQLDDEISAGVQCIQYQLITLMTTNGQAPFVSIFMYLNDCKNEQEKDDFVRVVAEILRQRIRGVKNEKGVWVTPAFPKLLYVLTEENCYEGSKYFWMTELAAKCTAKRLVPDFISEKKMKEYKDGDVYGCMGCRSFLTVDHTKGNVANAGNYEEGKRKYWGRFNQGVVTLNLVDVACSSYGDEESFWKILEERLELCHKALRARHNRLLGTPSDVAPILWQHGALARLEKGEPIDKLLYGGYSTLSLGYAGLYECVVYMTHESHTEPTTGKPFGLRVMKALNDVCAKWKAQEDIDYSVYGTPLESTTYKFAKCLQKRFGIIPGVTDRNFITNSYHVHVAEKINAFEKLSFEAEFQKLSPGGAISYVEVPNMQDNIPAVISIMQHIYKKIMYAELNTKSDYCMKCGYDGEIQIVEDTRGKLVWECPNCGNRDQNEMSVARRTCGYIGTQFWNQGRTAEIKARVIHVSN